MFISFFSSVLLQLEYEWILGGVQPVCTPTIRCKG